MTDQSNSLSRRGFLSLTTAAASSTALAALMQKKLAFADPASAKVEIEPGYVAPAYYDDKEQKALNEVLESGAPFRYWGVGEPVKVKNFEEGFAEHMGARFALAVTSGTAALDCAIAGLGLGPGDEVIVPAYCWWSDYTCVIHAGALPVFAEIDNTFNLDPRDFEKKITPRTKAVIAVHLLGGPCDLDPILRIAKEHNIKVVEDAAQCVGGSYRGKKLGSMGDVGIYSFQLNKMISSGEGGAVVTNDPVIYERAARFHDMGLVRSIFTKRTGSEQVEDFAGENFRMNEFTGAVLGAQLPKLDTMIREQRKNALAVLEGIADLPNLRLRRQPDSDGDIGYCVGFELSDKEKRDRCIQELGKRGVPASTLVGSVILPVQESIVSKRTRHPNWPSFSTPEGKAIEYGPACCPQTLEVFDRFVLIRIGPKYTDEQNRQIVAAAREVVPGFL